MVRSRFAVVMVLIASAGMTFMAAPPAGGQQANPCAADFKQHCSGITPGAGRLLRCYEEKKDRMSAACVGWAELVKSNAGAVKAACQKEIDSSCNFEKGDPLEMLDCIQSNYIDLSAGCRDKLNEFRGMYPKQAR